MMLNVWIITRTQLAVGASLIGWQYDSWKLGAGIFMIAHVVTGVIILIHGTKASPKLHQNILRKSK